jgi:hypothetical protein
LPGRFGSGLFDCCLNLIESTGKPFSTMMMLVEDRMDPAFKPFCFGLVLSVIDVNNRQLEWIPGLQTPHAI